MSNKFVKCFIFGWIGIGIMSLEGCGTLRTVAEGDATTRGNLTQVSSPCESIPRIYSGTGYNICMMRGKPSKASLWLSPGPEWILIDTVLSGALDTVVLPYTLYTQATQGNIILK